MTSLHKSLCAGDSGYAKIWDKVHGVKDPKVVPDSCIGEEEELSSPMQRSRSGRRSPLTGKKKGKGCKSCGKSVLRGRKGTLVPELSMRGGPGTELIRINEIRGIEGCPACHELAEKMDVWGPTGCEARIEEIIHDIFPRARAWADEGLITGFAPNFALAAAIRHDVRKAIRLARENSMKWSYGITTVPQRKDDLLPRTIESLRKAGFENPRLFIDGCDLDLAKWYRDTFGLPITIRNPKVGQNTNWFLGMQELYANDPEADRCVMFEDDIVLCKNTRQYLEKVEIPSMSYCNLYTFPQNQRLISSDDNRGWFRTKQGGLGALGLMFPRETVGKLLSSEDFAEKLLISQKRRPPRLDGKIVESMNKMKHYELCHNPSLVQHTGQMASTIGKKRHPLAPSFPGEDFDASGVLGSPIIPKAPTMRIGLMGPNCANDLGRRMYSLANHVDVDRWLVHPCSTLPVSDFHPDVDTVFCQTGNEDKALRFVDTIDVLLFHDAPHFTEVLDACLKGSVRMVCIPSRKMDSYVDQWTNHVALFICPTKEIYDEMNGMFPCVLFPSLENENELRKHAQELTDAIRIGYAKLQQKGETIAITSET